MNSLLPWFSLKGYAHVNLCMYVHMDAHICYLYTACTTYMCTCICLSLGVWSCPLQVSASLDKLFEDSKLQLVHTCIIVQYSTPSCRTPIHVDTYSTVLHKL